MSKAEQARKWACYHEAGHAVAARLCGLPIGFVEIDLSGDGKLGQVFTVFGETHHLHYQSMFHHLAGPISEKLAGVSSAIAPGISSQRDVVQATTLMLRFFTPDPNGEGAKEQTASEFPNAFSNRDQVEFVSRWLNQVTRDIESTFGQPLPKKAIHDFANKLIRLGDNKMKGKEAMDFIDRILGKAVGSVRPAAWYFQICNERPEFKWNLEVEEKEWVAINNTPPWED